MTATAKNPSRTVLVDMDGVLADFDLQVRLDLSARYPDIEHVIARTTFKFGEAYPDYGDVIHDIMSSPGFFRKLPLIEGAKAGWQRLIELGYQPRICSSPLRFNENCVQEKLAWLRQHFGAEVANDALITRNKSACDGIALIDDRPEIVDNHLARWTHVVFDQSYNQQARSAFRLVGWADQNLATVLMATEKMYAAKNPR